MIPFEDKMRAGGSVAIKQLDEFFARSDPVHQSLFAIAKRLDSLPIPYAVAGAMALVAHGHVRATNDIDILLSPEGRDALQHHLAVFGCMPLSPNSRNLRDTSTGVRIKFLITGKFPGDGKPKPIAFPDPASASTTIEGVRYLTLPRLIELKLASGLTNPNRLKDLADVQELIRTLRPPRSLADSLHDFVRPKFLELWDGLQNEPAEQ